jgi:hypothetical protein
VTSHFYLAVEDELSRSVGERLIRESWGTQTTITHLGGTGNGQLKIKLPTYISIAQRDNFLLLTDLDKIQCAPSLVEQWLSGRSLPEKFLFRIAVREVESWLMADRMGFAEYVNVQVKSVSRNPDTLDDPKASLIELVKSGKHSHLKTEIVPLKNVRAKQGLGYNQALRPFVESHWSIERAVKNSDSLKRTFCRLSQAHAKTI